MMTVLVLVGLVVAGFAAAVYSLLIVARLILILGRVVRWFSRRTFR